MGLLPDDIIIEMDEQNADNIDELLEIRNAKKRGDKFELTILREGKKIVLKGQFPEIAHYNAFNYKAASGAVKAIYYGNIFEIETSRIGELALYFHPEMINTDIPITVIINGETRLQEKIIFDNDFILTNFNENRDRKALWINKKAFKIE